MNQKRTIALYALSFIAVLLMGAAAQIRWGSIVGDIADQTDLQFAFSNKQNYDEDLDAWAAKTAPSGSVVGTSDAQSITNKSVSKAQNAVGSVGATTATVDWGESHTITATATTMTLAFESVSLAAGAEGSTTYVRITTSGGELTLTIPESLVPGETASRTSLLLANGATHVLSFEKTSGIYVLLHTVDPYRYHRLHVPVPTPNDYADTVRDKLIIWSNQTGKTCTVTAWYGWSYTDDTSINLEEYDADGASNNATVDAIELATGAGPYTGSDTTITAGTIETGHILALDYDDTDTPTFTFLTIVIREAL